MYTQPLSYMSVQCSLPVHYVHSDPVLPVCTVFTDSTLCTLRPCPTCLYSVHWHYTMYTQTLSYMSVQCSLTLHYVHSDHVLHVCTVFTARTLCILRPYPTCLYIVHCQYTMYTQPLSYMSVQCSLPVHYVHSDPVISVCSLTLLRSCHTCLFTDTTLCTLNPCPTCLYSVHCQ